MKSMRDRDPHQLLEEWLRWWRDHDEAPPKMPEALHIRTVLALIDHAPDDVERDRIFNAFKDART